MAHPRPRKNDNLRQRTRARRRALQALYQWQMADTDLAAIEAQFCDEMDMGKVDLPFFRELLHAVPARLHELDAQITPWLDRPLGELDPIELAVLRMGTFELNQRLDIPCRVVINESIELAKQFGGDQSHKYVNSVLDKIAHANSFRAAEMDRP